MINAPLPGFLFFDTVNRSSGLSFKGGVSIIAAMPDQVLSGHIDEKTTQFRDYYDQVGKFCHHIDCGFPIGGLFGHIAFNGKYEFGDYSKILVFFHERNEWLDIGGLSNLISSDLKKCISEIYIICLPTPTFKNKKPDLRMLLQATKTVGKLLKPKDLVIFESTVYPGCTEEQCVPILERFSKLEFNKNVPQKFIFLA